MAKTTRIRSQIAKLMDEGCSDCGKTSGPKNSNEILLHINHALRDGSTSNQLGNVLSKCGQFVKIGHGTTTSCDYRPYRVCTWDLTENHIGPGLPGELELKTRGRPGALDAAYWKKFVD